jgi:hypothetical protein
VFPQAELEGSAAVVLVVLPRLTLGTTLRLQKVLMVLAAAAVVVVQKTV